MSGLVSLRPVTDDDEPFLRDVYARTREAELAGLEWDTGMRAAFVEQQFSTHDRYYRQVYADAEFSVVLLEGNPVGRLYVVRLPDEIRVIEVALLPAHRDVGVGSRLLQSLLAEAARSERRVTVHVEKLSQARALYERLGFRTIADRGLHLLMEAVPKPRS